MNVSHLPAPPRREFDAVESLAERVRRLEGEAQGAAREHVQALEQSLAAAAAVAEQIGRGGEAYPIGARELARRLAADLSAAATTLAAIAGREA
jgi:hypothetical protein